MSINRLFEISRRSFQTLQAGMNTVGQNVANAGTDGYSRRRVSMQADSVVSQGIIMRTRIGTATGAGVSVSSYDRLRDGLLAAASADARTALGGAEEEQRLLGALEGIFPVGDGALGSVLGDFWDSWSHLADYPTDNGARLALRSSAEALTGTLHRADAALSLLEENTADVLATGIGEINTILQEIAAINETAEAARIKGSPDLVAEDRRDALVEQLSAFVPVKARPDGAAGYTVTVGGMAVVQGNHVNAFSLDDSGATPRVFFGETTVEYQADDGKLGAWLGALSTTFPDTRAALDTFAGTLVAEVNTLHRAGFGLDGGTGRDFFDPAALAAGSIQLSADVQADAQAIAASADPAGAGDSSVALDIAALRTGTLFGASETPDEFLANLLGDIGAKAQEASTRAGAQSAVLNHLEGMERGISGVSLDEEMTQLIQYQQAYAATARVLDTARTMMDTLLAL